jgi:hypothetical protein
MVTTQLIIDKLNNFHGTETVSMDLPVPLSSEIQQKFTWSYGRTQRGTLVVVKQENSSSNEIIQYDTPESELVINDNNQPEETTLQVVEISEESKEQPLLQSSEQVIVEPRRSARVAQGILKPYRYEMTTKINKKGCRSTNTSVS